jgi:hypothetical protein
MDGPNPHRPLVEGVAQATSPTARAWRSHAHRSRETSESYQ